MKLNSFFKKSYKNSNSAITSGLKDRTLKHEWQVQGEWGVGGMDGEK